MGLVRITQQSPTLTVAYEEEDNPMPNRRRIGMIGHAAPEGMEIDWEKTEDEGIFVDYEESEDGRDVPVGIMLDLKYKDARA